MDMKKNGAMKLFQYRTGEKMDYSHHGRQVFDTLVRSNENAPSNPPVSAGVVSIEPKCAHFSTMNAE
jgi:hypothetical protein